MKLTN